MAIDRALTVTVPGSGQKSSDRHKCGGASSSTPAGDLYVAWDHAKFTSTADFQQALMRVVQDAAGIIGAP